MERGKSVRDNKNVRDLNTFSRNVEYRYCVLHLNEFHVYILPKHLLAT